MTDTLIQVAITALVAGFWLGIGIQAIIGARGAGEPDSNKAKPKDADAGNVAASPLAPAPLVQWVILKPQVRPIGWPIIQSDEAMAWGPAGSHSELAWRTESDDASEVIERLLATKGDR